MFPRDLFWYAAIIGTGVFVLRTIMMMLSAEFGADHGHTYADTDNAAGTEHAFEILSVFSIAAFFMTFGWMGLYGREELRLGDGQTLLLSVASGMMALVAFGSIFRVVRRLTSDGASYSLDDTVGQAGSVYEQIPEDGRGRIQIQVGGMLREIPAVSEDKTAIGSFTRVEVVRAVDHETVSVRPKL